MKVVRGGFIADLQIRVMRTSHYPPNSVLFGVSPGEAPTTVTPPIWRTVPMRKTTKQVDLIETSLSRARE